MQASIKYELTGLEQIITDGTKNNPSARSVKKEVNRIKNTFVHEVFAFEDERHLERYIQYHQQALIRLMDHTSSLLNDLTVPKKKFYVDYYKGLDELLSFVERHFTKYFDQEVKAPEAYIGLARKEARENARVLQELLVERDADEHLITLILYVLNKIINSDADQSITYRRVMYAKVMQKELFRLLKDPMNEQNINDELRHVMYYLNYNSIKVLAYHAHYITHLLKEDSTRAEKLETLSLVLKTINQAQVKPGIYYCKNGCSLKEQLNSYILEEMDHQQRLQQLSGSGTDPSYGSLLDGFKFKFDASVMQLAYLLRVLLETKIILNNNLSQMVHFIVRFVITKRSEGISYGSFRSKFYAVESGTKESVRIMLLSLVRYIERS